MTEAFESAAAAFFEQMRRARAAGKQWWVDLQFRQIEQQLYQDRQIKALRHALEMVRDADDDCKTEGIHPLPIPEFARHAIDDALSLAATPFDPAATTFARLDDIPFGEPAR